MNTHSKKNANSRIIIPPNNWMMEWWSLTPAIISSRSPTCWMTTLTSTWSRETHVYMTFQDLEPEEIADQMWIKKKQARERRMRRIRQEAEIQVEKVKRLKRELWLAHKRSRTESGVLGIVWWDLGYWDMGSKRIKKEEPLTPSLEIKVEPPPTPPLTYHPSQTSTSRFWSIDPNNFVWSPIYAPSPY